MTRRQILCEITDTAGRHEHGEAMDRAMVHQEDGRAEVKADTATQKRALAAACQR